MVGTRFLQWNCWHCRTFCHFLQDNSIVNDRHCRTMENVFGKLQDIAGHDTYSTYSQVALFYQVQDTGLRCNIILRDTWRQKQDILVRIEKQLRKNKLKLCWKLLLSDNSRSIPGNQLYIVLHMNLNILGASWMELNTVDRIYLYF